MSATTCTTVPTMLVTRARVVDSARLSPAFQRVTLGSADFVDLAELGFDTRIKLVLPGPSGALPDLTGAGEDWYAAWLAMPEEERSPMRTYTVRDIVRVGEHVRLVVDLVVHDEQLAERVGPACRWALNARPGDELVVAGPHRAAQEAGIDYGGTEFDPAGRRELLLAGDETALPAIARILADLPAGHTGHAFVEVPGEADRLELAAPPGIEVHWVFRGDAAYGRPLTAAVRRHLGLAAEPDEAAGEPPSTGDREVWETPTHSAGGEDVEAQLARRSTGDDVSDLYAWVAGESWAVRSLRRALVRELNAPSESLRGRGLERAQVAFMGYWRQGVSMRS